MAGILVHRALRRVASTRRTARTAGMLGCVPSSPPRPRRPWVPRHVRITRSAADLPHTAEIVRRCEAAGVSDIEIER